MFPNRRVDGEANACAVDLHVGDVFAVAVDGGFERDDAIRGAHDRGDRLTDRSNLTRGDHLLDPVEVLPAITESARRGCVFGASNDWGAQGDDALDDVGEVAREVARCNLRGSNR